MVKIDVKKSKQQISEDGGHSTMLIFLLPITEKSVPRFVRIIVRFHPLCT
jgi:hypothetical protein